MAWQSGAVERLRGFRIVQGKSWGWISPKTLLASGAGLTLFFLFVSADFRSRTPLVDWSLFRSKNFRLSNSATFVFTAAFSAMFSGNVLFLKELWHYSTMQISLALVLRAEIEAARAVLCPLHGERFSKVAANIRPNQPRLAL